MGTLTKHGTTATSTNTFQWDAADRLVTISQLTPTNLQTSLFTYDGLGRRVQDVEETNGTAYITNKFIWNRQILAEQRDFTGSNATKRFFAGGEQIAGTSYYFTRDHLGSIREMVNTAGAIVAQYSYDAYGRQTLLFGTMVADFGYAGMFLHQPSGLSLTLFRGYSADLGRWLSRDPMAERGGLNLYEYVLNNPMKWLDPYGLCGGGGEVAGGAGSGRHWGLFFEGLAHVAEGVALTVVAVGSGATGVGIGVAVIAGIDGIMTALKGAAEIAGGLNSNLDQTTAHDIDIFPSNLGELGGYVVADVTGGNIENDEA